MDIFFDEAWRGPLFWPLYIGLVINRLSPQALAKHPLFQDSKKLTAKNRQLAFSEIQSLAEGKKISIAIASVEAGIIDCYGITQAIGIAICKGLYQLICPLMKRTLKQEFILSELKDLIREYEDRHQEKIRLILDGKSDFWLWKCLEIETKTIVHGDAQVKEIAIASILAKVSRDQHLEELSHRYPAYWLEKHKGYWTKEHYSKIQTFGTTKEHRKLFLKKLFPKWTIQALDFSSYSFKI